MIFDMVSPQMCIIDDELHSKIKNLVEKNKVDYPTIQFFVNQAVKEKIKNIEEREENGRD